MRNEINFDVIIIGAGGAGLMCAAEAGKRGRKVLVVDHAAKMGGKILISGGGRCNFTNKETSSKNYVSENPHFCKSALSRYTPADFISLVEKHSIAYHEKKLGQLFCDLTAKDIVTLLQKECESASVNILLNTHAKSIQKKQECNGFHMKIGEEFYSCDSLVMATGGLSLPKLGATGYGFELAKKFGHSVIELAPALDGFVFLEGEFSVFKALSGISLDCNIKVKNIQFRENILFTHSGLSGPAALQASLHWRKGDFVELNLLPDFSLQDVFMEKKNAKDKAILKNVLTEFFPLRFCELFLSSYFPLIIDKTLPKISNQDLQAISNKIHSWVLFPEATVGYSKAEVTRGGVCTDEVSSKTMESKIVPGLFFIGEVLDVTGWLGGYNFQWAWSSGWAAGQKV